MKLLQNIFYKCTNPALKSTPTEGINWFFLLWIKWLYFSRLTGYIVTDQVAYLLATAVSTYQDQRIRNLFLRFKLKSRNDDTRVTRNKEDAQFFGLVTL